MISMDQLNGPRMDQLNVRKFLPFFKQPSKENQKLTAKPFPVKKYGLERAKTEVPGSLPTKMKLLLYVLNMFYYIVSIIIYPLNWNLKWFMYVHVLIYY